MVSDMANDEILKKLIQETRDPFKKEPAPKQL